MLDGRAQRKYRELAEMAKDAATNQELLELAAACEGIADQIDDLRSARFSENLAGSSLRMSHRG